MQVSLGSIRACKSQQTAACTVMCYIVAEHTYIQTTVLIEDYDLPRLGKWHTFVLFASHNCFYYTSKPECAIPDDNANLVRNREKCWSKIYIHETLYMCIEIIESTTHISILFCLKQP